MEIFQTVYHLNIFCFSSFFPRKTVQILKGEYLDNGSADINAFGFIL